MKSTLTAPLGAALALALAACTPEPPPDTAQEATAPAAAQAIDKGAGLQHDPHGHDESPAQESAAMIADEHDHEHGHGDSHEEHANHADAGLLQLDDGTPWPVDAALVEGMQRIRDAVAAAQGAAPLDAVAATALAQTVEDQVAFLIANCQLEPAADATLHVLIARLLGAAAALRADPAAPDGLPVMLDTLDLYPRYFAHPGWLASGAG